jgi:hypothetical protein
MNARAFVLFNDIDQAKLSPEPSVPHELYDSANYSFYCCMIEAVSKALADSMWWTCSEYYQLCLEDVGVRTCQMT